MFQNNEYIIVVISGLLATAAMTIFTIVTFFVMKRPYNVIRILGNMLMFQPYTVTRHFAPPRQRILATFLHYAIGIIFAWGFQHYVMEGEDDVKMASLVYGIVIALIAIAGWRLFFFLHPGPPDISLKTYLLVIAAGHLILTTCLYVIYKHLISVNC